ncbi:hypothetical protein KFK09_013674 [Dendrobium nobile]|uniref:Uncharacterized protein n=1 Tax=Dendrobium nobile TaxID=94219 RepID=A0A8T3B9R1_DENNO|nr:hypothetical protein KFK09_013674 [Dendrobium nobile]
MNRVRSLRLLAFYYSLAAYAKRLISSLFVKRLLPLAKPRPPAQAEPTCRSCRGLFNSSCTEKLRALPPADPF